MSWHVKSRGGAVDAAYAETDALTRACPPPPRGCGAAPEAFCLAPSGTERHLPCLARVSGHLTVKEGGEDE